MKIQYENNKIEITKKYLTKNEELLVYVQPDKNINFKDISLDEVKFSLDGNDVILDMPEGKIRLLSIGLFVFNDEEDINLEFQDQILSTNNLNEHISMINQIPIDSEFTDKQIEIKNNLISGKTTDEIKNIIPEVNKKISMIEDVADTFEKFKEDFDSNSITNIPEDNPENDLVSNVDFKTNIIEEKVAETLKTKEAQTEGSINNLTFDIDIQHVTSMELIVGNDLYVTGGGGTFYSNEYPTSVDVSELSKQGDSEIIDYSYLTSSDYDKLIIKTEDTNLLNNDFVSRKINLTASQPLGFEVSKITIGNVPDGVSIINGVDLGNGIWEITKNTNETTKYYNEDETDGFYFNDKTGEIEFNIKYDTTINEDFILDINVETTWDIGNFEEGTPPEEMLEPIFTTLDSDMEYAINIKETNVDNTLSYQYDEIDIYGQDGSLITYENGFVLSTNLNGNIVIGGNLDTEVYGGFASDIVTTFDGDDIIKTAEGDDVAQLGYGDDIYDGGEGSDTVDFSNFDNRTPNDPYTGVNVDLKNNIATGQGTDTITNVENIIGSDFKDVLTGDDANNIINGGKSNDIINGGIGDDVLYGGDNNDIIIGGEGDDVIYGGEGSDTIDFSSTSNDIHIELQTEDFTNLGIVGGKATGDGTDYLYEIENITGGTGNDFIIGNSNSNIIDGNDGIDTISFENLTTNFIEADLLQGIILGDGIDYILNIENIIGTDYIYGNDIIIGNELNNILQGMQGNDTIDGGEGNDVLDGGNGDDLLYVYTGDDTIDGGEGIDTLSFIKSENSITIDLKNSTSTGNGNDTITNIENINGSNFDDVIKGDDNINILYGGNGDDIISTYGSNVSNINTNSYDIVDGGSGNDTISYSFTDVNVMVDLSILEEQSTGLNDVLIKNTENIIGGNGSDILLGNDYSNIIDGGDGDDVIYGGGGDDTLDGGSGYDVLDYTKNIFAGVKIDMSNNGSEVINDGYANIDTISNFELIQGSTFSDEFKGSNILDDKFNGGSGDDFIYTSDGNDVLNGELGDDTFYVIESTNSNSSTNTLYGGSGNDILSFEQFTHSVNIDFSDTNIYTNNNVNIEINNISGISGSDFDDTIKGSSGNDFIYSGLGDDTLYATTGDDFINGEDGFDTLDLSDINNGITIDLIDRNFKDIIYGGEVGESNIVTNIEDFKMTTNADLIQLNSEMNSVDGNGGADLLTYKDYTYAITIDLSGDNNNTDGYQIVGVSSNGDDLDKIINIDNVEGSNNDDTIIGNDNVNYLYGNDGSDILNGGEGDDYLYGENGNDTFIYELGNDIFDGGTGVDTIDYTNSTNFIIANLKNNEVKFDNSIEIDTVFNTEKIIGSLGNDIIEGSLGNDIIDGNSNSVDGDTISFANSLGNIKVNLGITTAQDTNEGSDIITNIENIEGSTYSDILTGDSNTNIIHGGNGDDVIDGSLGDDIIFGDEGDDKILINNILDGNDTIDGGSGTNYLSFENITNGITIDLNVSEDEDGYKHITMDSEEDKIKNVENLIGTFYNDNLTGDNLDNIILASDGDDTLSGGDGNDTLDGQNGNDTLSYSYTSNDVVVDFSNDEATISATSEIDNFYNIENVLTSSGQDTFYMNDDLKKNSIDGDSGTDIVSFENYNNGVNVDLSITDYQTIRTSGEEQDLDKILNIENLKGSIYSDNLTGDSNDNQIFGNFGDDTINTSGGNDYLYGGYGNDTFVLNFDDGVDYIDGEGDTDTLDYSAFDSNYILNVSLNTSNEVDTTLSYNGTDSIDKIKNIENIIGTGGNDNIIGDSNSNKLEGGDGNDTINGGDGNDFIYGDDGDDLLDGGNNDDYLYGGNGDDTLISALGNDVYDGGLGIDTLTFENSANAITIDLNTNVQNNVDGTTTIYNIENLKGTNFDDVFHSNISVDNNLDGNSGLDTIDYTNFDSSVSDVTTDYLITNLSDSSVTFTHEGVNYTISGYTSELYLDQNLQSTDTLQNIEIIKGTSGNDYMIGSTGDDTIYGNDGNDKLSGGLGVNELWGGDGIDSVDYSFLSKSLNINLNNNLAVATDGSTDVMGVDNLHEIENVVGGTGNDYILGDSSDNTLDGNSGIDTLDLSSLNYGDSNAIGANIVLNSFATDLDVNNALMGNDILINFENIIGSSSIDVLEGDSLDNNIDAGDGNDIIHISEGNDIIDGNLGQDTLDLTNFNSVNNTLFNIDITLNDTNLSTTNFYDSNSVLQDGNNSTLNFQTQISNIENVLGTDLNDRIIGDLNSNDLNGLDGNDYLDGGSGIDIVDGGAGDDIVLGGLDNDNIWGGSGMDYLSGDSGDDFVYGGLDNDILTGGSGTDFLDGETGVNTYDSSSAITTMTIDLRNLSEDKTDTTIDESQYYVISSNSVTDQGVNYIKNIQNVIGSKTETDDILLSNNISNEILSLGGDDIIRIQDSSHVVITGDDNDSVIIETPTDYTSGDINVIDGGSGEDNIDFTNFDKAITINFNNILDSSNDTSLNISGQTLDPNINLTNTITNLVSVEYTENGTTYDRYHITNIEEIIGSVYSDIIYDNNTIDTDNIYSLGDGADVVYGGYGDDIIDGGSLSDNNTIDYINLNNDYVSFDIKNNLVNIIDSNNNIIYTDEIINIQTLKGTNNDDIFINDANSTNIDQTMDGGDGIDTVSHTDYQNHLYIDMENNSIQLYNDEGTLLEDDEIYNIENIIGGLSSDYIKGDSLVNNIDGYSGNDIIYGGEGNDVLSGGLGDDIFTFKVIDSNDSSNTNVLVSGTNDDLIYGGDGIDTIDYSSFKTTYHVDIDLTISSNLYIKDSNSNIVKTDIINSIEKIKGTGTSDVMIGNGNNIFIGNDGDDILTAGYDDSLGSDENLNELYGGNGNDTLTGSKGKDIIYGENDDDLIYGSLGIDIIDGGDGVDTIDYNSSSNFVIVDLSTNVASGEGIGADILINIENINGSNYNDLITGNDLVNEINAADGDDKIFSSSGIDIIDGGSGNDTIDYTNLDFNNLGIDVVLNGSTEVNVLSHGKTESDTDGIVDKIVNVENIIGTKFIDNITGDSQDNIFDAGEGDDIIIASIGNDTIDGGLGSDYLDASDVSFDGIIMNLGSTEDINGVTYEGYTYELSSNNVVYDGNVMRIENLKATSGDDIIIGSSEQNIIEGMEGEDIVYVKKYGNSIYANSISETSSDTENDMIAFNLSLDGIYYQMDKTTDSSLTAVKQQTDTSITLNSINGFKSLRGTNVTDEILLNSEDWDNNIYLELGDDILRLLDSDSNSNKYLDGGGGYDSFNIEVAGIVIADLDESLSNNITEYGEVNNSITEIVNFEEFKTYDSDTDNGEAIYDDEITAWKTSNENTENRIYTFDGDDIIHSSKLGHKYYMGDGDDTVDYNTSTQDLTLTIGKLVTDYHTVLSGSETSFLYDVENINTGTGNDTAYSSTEDSVRNIINLYDGNDTAYLLNNNTSFDGQNGTDIIFVGFGNNGVSENILFDSDHIAKVYDDDNFTTLLNGSFTNFEIFSDLSNDTQFIKINDDNDLFLNLNGGDDYVTSIISGNHTINFGDSINDSLIIQSDYSASTTDLIVTDLEILNLNGDGKIGGEDNINFADNVNITIEDLSDLSGGNISSDISNDDNVLTITNTVGGIGNTLSDMTTSFDNNGIIFDIILNDGGNVLDASQLLRDLNNDDLTDFDWQTSDVISGSGDDEITISSKLSLFTNGGEDIININSGFSGYVNSGIDNDTFNITSGSGWINGDEGDDTFNIVGSSIEIHGDEGDDTFNITENMSGGFVYGGVGINTYNVSAYISDGRAGDDVSYINLQGGFTGWIDSDGGNDIITYDNSINSTDNSGSLEAGSGSDTININGNLSGVLYTQTGNDIININSNADMTGTIYTGDDNDTVNIGANMGDTDWFIDTGLGNDTINITVNQDAEAIEGDDSDISTGSGNDTVNISDNLTINRYIDMSSGTNIINFGDNTTLNSDITSTAGTYTLTYNNSTIGNSNTLINGDIYLTNDSTQTIKIEDVNGNVTTGSGSDYIQIVNVNDIVAGAGDNIIKVTNANSISVDSGTGNDKISIYGTLTEELNLGGGDNELYVSDSGYVSKIITGSDNDIVEITDNGVIDNIDLGDGNNEITFVNTVNSISVGLGNDTITFNGNSELDSDLNTGDGNDTVNFTSGTFINDVDLGEGSNTVNVGFDIENVTFGTGSDTINVIIGNTLKDVSMGDGDDEIYLDASLNDIDNIDYNVFDSGNGDDTLKIINDDDIDNDGKLAWEESGFDSFATNIESFYTSDEVLGTDSNLLQIDRNGDDLDVIAQDWNNTDTDKVELFFKADSSITFNYTDGFTSTTVTIDSSDSDNNGIADNAAGETYDFNSILSEGDFTITFI